jgi:predicted outer membrane repeat protein
VEDCRFTGNEARSGGALASFRPARTTFSRCTFIDNSALEDGGALYLFGQQTADPLANCLFAGNHANARGGAVFATAVPTFYMGVNVFGCTFVHNQAGQTGGALYLASDLHIPEFGNRLFNCIVWHNFAPAGPQITLAATTNGDGPHLWVAHSDVMGGQAAIALLVGSIQWDAGNLDVYPLFTDPDGPDDNVLTFLDNDYRPAAGAPVNDAGWNAVVSVFGNLDLDLGPRQVEDPAAPNTGNGTSPIVDMGAYEFP